MGRMEDRVAFITGAARGQGRSHAVRLAQEGADIVGVDICKQLDGVLYALATPEDLDETVNLVEKTGRRMVARHADVRDRKALAAAFADGIAEFGHIDTVVANAGILLNRIDEPDPEAAWELGIGVMLTGVWNTMQIATDHMIEAGHGGAIIVTSSMAGLRALTDGTGGSDAYAAAKIGVTGLVRAYAQRLAPNNIRVNAIAPTGVATTMIVDNPALFEVIEKHEHLANAFKNSLPVQLIEPGDVSETVLFLVANDSGRYYTGSTLMVDAGMNIA
jgi:SDR family mycofactocin-dependent oxidoreductase